MAKRTYKIPTVLSSEELMDKAFHRASKISVSGVNFLDAKKKTTLAKITASGDIIKDTLDGYVNSFPRIEKDEDFLPELVDLVIGIDDYKKSLGALNWTSARIEKLKNESLRNIRRSKDPEIIESVKNQFYGRASSFIKQISSDLLFLQEAKNKFRNLPSIESNVATVVVAGFPNVGKSNLVTVLSTAAPEIAPYPFTTKGIIIGHIEDGWRKYQIIDTPGLLDRELSERNDIEKQAILALKYLTHVILIVLDPSETCGYSMEKQLALLKSVENGFPGVPIIVAESKNDIMRTGNPDRICFSAATGDNVETLRAEIIRHLKNVEFPEDEEEDA
ncbi:MAG: 50S ribosome-binding GTPase [Candidatus Methanomethylophilaceae archaeon]|nr:GTP-binding protein [Thermoplasmata archaeon]MBQ2762281.1 50S ribosome-binding GTPase [Candidatus Methanomethylophilaceae archaeon]